jgi:hypothetical protein
MTWRLWLAVYVLLFLATLAGSTLYHLGRMTSCL